MLLSGAERKFRVWINEEKLFDVPKRPAGVIMNQLYFEVSHTNYAEEQYAIYVSNIKVATVKPDTSIADRRRYSPTTGILFDFKCRYQTESYA